MKLGAVHKDSGDNAKVIYRIYNWTDTLLQIPFEINETSGNYNFN